MKSLIIIVLAILFSSCSIQKRYDRLLRLHPELTTDTTYRIDTITELDTIYLDPLIIDTVAITTKIDTVEITKLLKIYVPGNSIPISIPVTTTIIRNGDTLGIYTFSGDSTLIYNDTSLIEVAVVTHTPAPLRKGIKWWWIILILLAGIGLGTIIERKR